MGDGNSSFWFTNWSGIGNLYDKVLYVDIHDLELRVNDVFTNGRWNFNLLYTNLPNVVKDRLQQILLCLNTQVAECYTWKGNLNGVYSAQDGYYWLNRSVFNRNDIDSISWSWIWHVPAPEKLKFFLWTALHNALPTRSMLYHRRMLPSNTCPRCNLDIETVLHCLRDCAFARRFWHMLGFSSQSFFQENNLYNWLRHGICGASMFLFLAAVWWLWRARNNLCMANDLVPLGSLRMITINYAQLLANCSAKHNAIPNTRWIRWNAQAGSEIILNVDGSSLGNPGVSGFGGLIRNSGGKWIRGFAGNIGISNVLHAELLALYHGLIMAWELGFSELLCYSDSQTAIKLIYEPVNSWHHYAAILHNIKDLLERNWRVQVTHTLREGKTCADYLAKFGANNSEAYTQISDPPNGMRLLLLADASGTFFSR